MDAEMFTLELTAVDLMEALEEKCKDHKGFPLMVPHER